MAYVPGAKNDIFISYAHVDNERDSHDVRWVSEFVRGFMVELRQRLGGPKDFALFFDESDLEAHHRLDFLLENARQSAIFVAVLSPSYVSHDWTTKELREFATITSDSRRIVVVEKLPLEVYDKYPREIEDHKRTQFWRTNEPESHTPSTLTVYGRPADYRSRLETLADQVQRLMREMRRATEQAQAAHAPPQPAEAAPVQAAPAQAEPARAAPVPAAPVPAAEPVAPPPPPPKPDPFPPPPRTKPEPPRRAPGSLIGSLWPETARNRGRRRLILTAVASMALILACLLGHMLDPTASGSTIAIHGPLTVLLVISATLDRRTTLIAIAVAAVAQLIIYVALFSHFRMNTIVVFWLGLVIAQLAAAAIIHRTISDVGPPALIRIAGAMLAAAFAWELFEAGGIFLGLWIGAPGTSFADAWTMVADHITQDPTRWVSALIGAILSIVVTWLAWRLVFRFRSS